MFLQSRCSLVSDRKKHHFLPAMVGGKDRIMQTEMVMSNMTNVVRWFPLGLDCLDQLGSRMKP